MAIEPVPLLVYPTLPRLWDLEGKRKRVAAERAAAEQELEREREERRLDEIRVRLVELGEADVHVHMLRTMPLRQALKLCPTEADVRRLAKLRGYKPGFVWHVMQEGREAADA
jgi:hypothetical protein